MPRLIEALYSEINKLPPAQRQKRLEDGARKEGGFKFYGISAAALLGCIYRRLHEALSVHQGGVLAWQRQ